VVEKILSRHESMREDWPVQGTTGYEVPTSLLGLLVDPAGEEGFSRTYAGLHAAVQKPSPPSCATASSNHAERDASELMYLPAMRARVARQNPRTADFTRNILQRALKEIVACFPVYRTYVDGPRRRPRPTGATSTGPSPRPAGTRPTSTRASSTSCTAC
jgi:(1->4)-alpha-D-glucan 1-alpha-D-glucosylmutase